MVVIPRGLIATVCLLAQVVVAITPPPGLVFCVGCPAAASAAPACDCCGDGGGQRHGCCAAREDSAALKLGSCCVQVPVPRDQQRPEPRVDLFAGAHSVFAAPVVVAVLPPAAVVEAGWGRETARSHPPPVDRVILTGRLLI